MYWTLWPYKVVFQFTYNYASLCTNMYLSYHFTVLLSPLGIISLSLFLIFTQGQARHFLTGFLLGMATLSLGLTIMKWNVTSVLATFPLLRHWLPFLLDWSVIYLTNFTEWVNDMMYPVTYHLCINTFYIKCMIKKNISLFLNPMCKNLWRRDWGYYIFIFFSVCLPNIVINIIIKKNILHTKYFFVNTVKKKARTKL